MIAAVSMMRKKPDISVAYFADDFYVHATWLRILVFR